MSKTSKQSLDELKSLLKEAEHTFYAVVADGTEFHSIEDFSQYLNECPYKEPCDACQSSGWADGVKRPLLGPSPFPACGYCERCGGRGWAPPLPTEDLIERRTIF